MSPTHRVSGLSKEIGVNTEERMYTRHVTIGHFARLRHAVETRVRGNIAVAIEAAEVGRLHVSLEKIELAETYLREIVDDLKKGPRELRV